MRTEEELPQPINLLARSLASARRWRSKSQLAAAGIETVALCGFLTNCCVESTMRTAYEKGFNVITLSDCCAATSEEGQKAAIEGTFGMFSKTMTAEEFKAELSK